MKLSESTPPRSHAALAINHALALLTLAANPVSAYTAEIFAAPGTVNWVCPTAVTSVKVECWGGGGAGGGALSGTGLGNAGGGGGGGGAYAALNNVTVTPGNTYTFIIPAAATCPNSGFTNAQKYDGSSVTFTGDGPISVTANGGIGGGSAVVTTGTAISGAAGPGGAAGTSFDAAWKGGNAVFWSSGNGGGGGGGAGDLAAGGNSTAVNGSFGLGGTGSDTDHAGGNGGASKNGAGSGNNALSPGGGGGGAKSTAASPSSRAGGSGGLGRVILTYTPVYPTIVKGNNTFALSSGASWVGGLAPDASKVAKWNNTVASANTTVLNADLNWAGIAIENPNGLVSIDPGHTLTLGAGGIDMGTADTANLTLNCPLALGAANVWIVATGRTLTLGGAVSGPFSINKQGAGRVILSSITTNTYTGDTTINSGTLQLGTANIVPDGAGKGNVVVNGVLDLNGRSEALNSLSGTGTIDNSAATSTCTLTIGNNDQSGTLSGVIRNTGSTATLNLTKTGTGTQILGGANTLSGAVSIAGGTLAVTNIAPLANVSGITIGDGTKLRPDVTNAVINAPITLGAVGTTSTITAPNVPGSGTTNFPINLGGAVSGAGNLTLSGISASNAYGVINLNAASNYTGTTLITCSDELASPSTLGNQNIFVKLFVTNTLPVTTVVTLDGGDGAPLATSPGRFCELDLNGNDQTLAGLTNVTGRTLRVQRVVSNSATTATLTINNALPHTYTGQLGWVSGFGSTTYNNFNLIKSGVGTQTLSGPLRYSGNTTVTGGTFSLGTVNPNNELSTITITAPGIMQLTFAGSDTVDKLFINGIQRPAGTYGRTGTGATNGGSGEGAFDAYFADGTGTLTVTTSPPAGGYASWQNANGPNTQTIDLDHDNDGVKNGIEYFLGGNTNTTGVTALPAVVNTAGTLSITWTKSATYTGIYGTNFWVETSATLSNPWVTQASPGTVTIAGDEVKYTFPVGTTNFARLKVTGP